MRKVHSPFKRKGDWVGATVEVTREIKNTWHRVPMGTKCTVRRNYGGLELETEPCPHCGVSIFIAKVPESAVAVISGGKQKGVTDAS